jgi:predicted MFS family arabinose efflux permease
VARNFVRPAAVRSVGAVPIFADVTPLKRSPAFRRYFIGQVVSLLGSQFTVVAMRYQAYQITGKTYVVGLLGLTQLFPLLVSAIGLGQLADAVDRRRILLVTQVLLACCSLALAVNARLAHPSLVLLFVLAAVSSFVVGVDWPTRNAFLTSLVGTDLLRPSLALNQVLFNLAAVIGPTVAGFVIQASTSSAYAFDAASYVFLFAIVVTLPSQARGHGKVRLRFSSVGDGLRYARDHRLLRSTFMADIGAMVFGLPDALFPAMAVNVFHGGARTFGFLQAAPGAGAMVTMATTGWTARVRRQGRAVITCIAVWGAAIAVFGLSRWLPLALIALAVAGGADAVSALFRSTIVQVTTPDEFRGRLSALHIAVVRGGPRVGEMESGVAASVIGLQAAAWTGGLACLVWIAVTAWRYPELARYDTADAAADTTDAVTGVRGVTGVTDPA